MAALLKSLFFVFNISFLRNYRIKDKDITITTKCRIVNALVFPVVLYGCESWTIRKAERRRIDSFELWCWRRLLRIPWTARRTNQSVIEEIKPTNPLEVGIPTDRQCSARRGRSRQICRFLTCVYFISECII